MGTCTLWSMAYSSFRSAPAAPSVGADRLYRLVDQQCCPHPVLDDHFDSMDAAWEAAIEWWQEQSGGREEPIGIGVEVSTARGDWRTLRYPGGWSGWVSSAELCPHPSVQATPAGLITPPEKSRPSPP